MWLTLKPSEVCNVCKWIVLLKSDTKNRHRILPRWKKKRHLNGVCVCMFRNMSPWQPLSHSPINSITPSLQKEVIWMLFPAPLPTLYPWNLIKEWNWILVMVLEAGEVQGWGWCGEGGSLKGRHRRPALPHWSTASSHSDLIFKKSRSPTPRSCSDG